MGIDFIRGKAKSFKKGLDREAIALATPDLFTITPHSERRVIAGDIAESTTVEVGEHLVVRLTDRGLIAYRGIIEVASFPEPPTDILAAVRAGFGVADAVVEDVGELSGTVKVSLR